MKIGLCQLDPTVGDFAGNCSKIESAVHAAVREGARLVVCTELVVCGYPPEDLLLRKSFLEAHDRALAELAANVPPAVSVLVGCLARNREIDRGGRPLRNAVAMLEDGIARVVARKSLLPTYDVFDESRFFEPWDRPEENIVTVADTRVGILICEDSWNDPEFFTSRLYRIDPVQRVVEQGVDVVVNLSASPWAAGKERFRYDMIHASAKRHGVPMIYVNQVGGNVGLQFDGASFAVKPDGAAFAPTYFTEGVHIVDTDEPWTLAPPEQNRVAMQYAALVQGIRSYSQKFGFPKAVLGLSGGIDSALTAVLAVDALGAANVAGLAMPSHYSSGHSLDDAERLAHNLGIEFHRVPIGPLQDAFGGVLESVFAGTEPGVAEENLQARSRGALLMAFANKFGHLLLTTGNKSECAVGYCTLYGDMCGALAPIADLWKTEVYAMARWINRENERIPVGSIEKPPSAELRPGQLDTDSLPPYEELDPVLRCLVEREMGVVETAAQTGMAIATVAELYRKVMASEFKRYQYAPTLRVSDRCWGGRRVPVCHRFMRETGTGK
jgi:NAD+ synthetase